MTPETGPICSEDRLAEILAVANADSERGIELINQTLTEAPRDARLHFLKGSLLIGLKRFIGAHEAMRNAIEIDPEFRIARFQLGFFELTSGEAQAAITTWNPLKQLPLGNYLRHFVDGLEHLIADRFEACVTALRAGLEANHENPPLNRDIELVIAQCEELIGRPAPAPPPGDEPVSATSVLLGGIAIRPTNRESGQS